MQPVSSKVLDRKWKDKDHEIHKKRLKDIKSQVDLAPPSTFYMQRSKAKKEQILEGKVTTCLSL